MWTLRDEKYCDNDFWVEVLQNLTKNKNFTENISEENLLDVKKIILKKKYSFDKNLLHQFLSSQPLVTLEFIECAMY